MVQLLREARECCGLNDATQTRLSLQTDRRVGCLIKHKCHRHRLVLDTSHLIHMPFGERVDGSIETDVLREKWGSPSYR
jgi:hypothetical protein